MKLYLIFIEKKSKSDIRSFFYKHLQILNSPQRRISSTIKIAPKCCLAVVLNIDVVSIVLVNTKTMNQLFFEVAKDYVMGFAHHEFGAVV